MVDSKESRVKTYFNELNKLIENSSYQKIVKTANKIIGEYPDNELAWKCKIVALIHLSQFKEAFDAANRSKLKKSVSFEKAYAQYRMNDITGALATISEIENDSLKVKELKAQILYRLERYGDCFSIYRELIRSTSDEFDLERHTNMTAVVANKAYEGDDIGAITRDDSSYELMYNGACQLLAVGELTNALHQLQLTETKCRNYLASDEGVSEEEISEEVAIIRVQQGHCLQLLGKEREALSIYNNVLKTKPEDSALLAIINNNIVAINRGSNVFDSRKRMKAAQVPDAEHKLLSKQKAYIALNSCLLAFHTHQNETCLAEARAIAKQFSFLSNTVCLIESVTLAQSENLDAAFKVLQKKSNNLDSTLLQLAAVQLSLNQGDIRKAAECICEMNPTDKFRSGVVSALVSLHTALGEKEVASSVLRNAVEWHKSKQTSSSSLSELWRNAADFHLRSGDAKTAAASLEELWKLHPSDIKTLAQLIIALSQFDIEAAHKLSQKLPSVIGLTEGLQAENLEASFGYKYFKKTIGFKGEGTPTSPKSVVSPNIEKTNDEKKKKKRKKPRLPKNYVGTEPDPERWLPKWQRKGYRKKKDKRKDVMRGTQGVSSDAMDKYDITKTAGQHKKTQQVIQQPESSGPKRNMPKKKHGGKKKKGW